ncbi:hypothetical protein LDO51_10990 [Providencia alcalifaciens]|uniref:hypothetical protein n=1 Tax=Providencia alcalifaciens TaxID=126385 RepID=UPI001CE0ABDE|nr:hypothetical protein [Providencia alcalifaciens]UBX47722.1 hypothetical protein LDO51_10990 [Providencia alcalifaciens]
MRYQLTYAYSQSAQFYGVETNLSLEQFQQACAYIQLIRDKLPSFSSSDDCLVECETLFLLQMFYGFTPLYENREIDAIVDVHHNWECYVIGGNLASINQYAICNASIIMLEFLRYKLQAKLNTYTNESVKVDLARLDYLLSGHFLKREWALRDVYGNDLTGMQFLRSDKVELISKEPVEAEM